MAEPHNKQPSIPTGNISFPSPPQSETLRPDRAGQRFLSPQRLLLVIMIAIFLAEVIAMIVVYFFNSLPYQITVLIDASIMLVMITPVLYLLSFRPLLHHIRRSEQAEQALQKRNRALHVLNECNQLLIHAESETEFLHQMCEVIVRTGEYRMAWIGLAQWDEARSIRPIAQCGFEEGYLEQAQITWADNERGRGPTGSAIRLKEVQVNQNFLTNPKMIPWREAALSRGYQASIALPLQNESATIGALTIYSALPSAFDDEEVQLLKELANNLTLGIMSLQIRAERQQAEEKNRRLSRIVEQAEDTVVVTNRDGIIEYVNPAFENLTGYTGKEVLGQTPRILKSGAHGDHFYRELWGTILQGNVFQGEIANRKKDGEIFYEVKTITPLRDAQDTITHFVATGRDITEREKIEQQLRIRTTAMETAANGILITDRQGNIQWANPALSRMSGYTTDDLIGRSTRIFNSGQHHSTYYRQMWNTILSGQVWQGEMTNRRKDGSLYTEEQTITPVRDDDGNILQFIAIKQDITERKRAEQEIQEREQKENVLTQTIHTMQLDIARDLHDTLGQNISFLRMKLDYLSEKKPGKKTELQLELQSMARAANESYDLMRGTLAMLQSETSADLFQLFKRYAEQIQERTSFQIDLASQGEPRFMSAKRMRQVFYVFREILNNIEKHARASHVSIVMAWGNQTLSLQVCDNGTGFDQDNVLHGDHYGLRFMKDRAELLGGSLRMHSEAGSGTEVTLEVPYA